MLLIAGGFVLGEVLILLMLLTVRQMTGLITVLVVCFSSFKRRGRSARWWLLLFCVCLIMGGLRAEAEKAIINESASVITLVSQTTADTTVRGTLHRIEKKEYNNTIELREVQVLNGDQGYHIPGLLLTVKPELCSSPAGSLKIGMELTASGEIKPFDFPGNPGQFHPVHYHRANRITGRMTVANLMISDSRCNWLRSSLQQFREICSQRLQQLVRGSEAGIFQAAVLGNKENLDPEVKELYQRNGISHLLALSGLHLSLLILLVYRSFRRTGLGYLSSGFISALLAAAYAIMTGSPISVLRAVIMLICGFLAATGGKRYDLLSAMSLAAILLLCYRPYLVFQAGFQLSFAAIAGIGFIFPHVAAGRPGKVFQAIALGVSIQVIALPITLYHFYQTSIYAILLNLIVIPLMAFVVASGVAGIGFSTLHPWLGRFAVGAGYYVLRFYERLCAFAEAFPHSVWITGRPTWPQLAVYIFILTILFRYWKRQKRKATCRRVFILLSLQLILFIRLPPPGLQVTFLDVGQGDGICIRAGGQMILVDCGSSDVRDVGQYRLEPYLKNQGISKLDYVYISHGDEDHVNGIRYLLEQGKDIRIRNLMLPAAGREHPAYTTLCQLVQERGGTIHWIGAGDEQRIDHLIIQCLYPRKEVPIAEANAHSLVLKISYGQFHLLLTGDIGSKEENLILSDAATKAWLTDIQVLKLAHHGSRFSTSEEWLRALNPRWAVVSYGQDNSYGHPHEALITRTEAHSIRLFRTAEEGAIRLQTDGKTIQWDVYRKP